MPAALLHSESAPVLARTRHRPRELTLSRRHSRAGSLWFPFARLLRGSGRSELDKYAAFCALPLAVDLAQRVLVPAGDDDTRRAVHEPDVLPVRAARGGIALDFVRKVRDRMDHARVGGQRGDERFDGGAALDRVA